MVRLILLQVLLFPYCAHAQDSLPGEHKTNHDKVAILKASKNGFSTNATLTKTEIIIVEEILSKCISDHNSITDSKMATHLMNKEMYNRQYIPFIKDGKKQVWVNCFCDGVEHFPNWKKQVITVYDGGGCYFNVLINLEEKKYSQLYVNGIG